MLEGFPRGYSTSKVISKLLQAFALFLYYIGGGALDETRVGELLLLGGDEAVELPYCLIVPRNFCRDIDQPGQVNVYNHFT